VELEHLKFEGHVTPNEEYQKSLW